MVNTVQIRSWAYVGAGLGMMCSPTNGARHVDDRSLRKDSILRNA
jgi:hypothetical protein